MLSATIRPDVTIAASNRALDAWRAYADSGRAPKDIMSALSLEGFLTGLLICPKELAWTTWLPRIWGDTIPQFEDDDEWRAARTAIDAVKKSVAARLALGRDHYRPACIPAIGRPRLDDVREWVAGFAKILELNPEWWLRLHDDRKLRNTMIPFLGFLPDGQGRCMEETDDNRDQLYLHASGLPVAVLVLDRLQKKRQASAAASPARNARCPCGSGRKFKHCCA